MSYNSSFKIEYQIVSSIEAISRKYRLDPSQYNEASEKIIRCCKENHIKVSRLKDLGWIDEVYLPNRFSRAYTQNENIGVPMLGTSSMLTLKLPMDSRIILNDNRQKSELSIQDGDILISRSGTVGTTVHCGKSYNGFVASDDCIRLRVKKEFQGYVTAFLRSYYGQTLLVRDAHGKVIKHLKPEDVSNLQTPVLGEEKIKKINEDMLKVTELFDQSRLTLIKVDELLRKYFEDLIPQKIENDSFNIIGSINIFDNRLDPHLYNPHNEFLLTKIKQKEYKLLGNIADVWGVPRFKRHYVEGEKGTSLYSSSDIMRAKLNASKKISTKLNSRNISQCIIKEGTILIPCSGTYGGILGRGIRAGKTLNDKVVTQHVLRIKCKDTDIDPDYLAAFLCSKDFGYPLITSSRFGKDIPEIGPEYLKHIPIPVIDKNKQKEIGDLFREAINNQDSANELEESILNFLSEELE